MSLTPPPPTHTYALYLERGTPPPFLEKKGGGVPLSPLDGVEGIHCPSARLRKKVLPPTLLCLLFLVFVVELDLVYSVLVSRKNLDPILSHLHDVFGFGNVFAMGQQHAT